MSDLIEMASAPSEPSDFAQQVMGKMAQAFGITYEQMGAINGANRARPLVTAKMLRLATSTDRRKWKRAWRLYFQANGRAAPHSYFGALISEANVAIWARMMQHRQAAIFERWLEKERIEGRLAK